MLLDRILVEAGRTWPRRPFTTAAYRYAQMLGKTPFRRRVGTLLSGAQIDLDLSQWMHREIFLHGFIEAEPGTTLLLKGVATPGWTFFDVGANEGYYALLAADLGGRDATVVAFEPQRQLADLVRSSAARNGYSIAVIEVACAASAGKVLFYPSGESDNTGAASLIPVFDTEPVEIDSITLDKFCCDSGLVPDVMKVDVEGSELEVMQGFGETLASTPPRLIVCELTDDPRHPGHRDLPRFLATFGYEAWRVTEDGSLSHFDRPGSLENVAFVR